jgi:hypothetical protein
MNDPASASLPYVPVTWAIYKLPDLTFIEGGFTPSKEAETRVAELGAEDPALVGAFQITRWPPPPIRAAAGEGPGPFPEDRGWKIGVERPPNPPG